jgi:hypothetical protein
MLDHYKHSFETRTGPAGRPRTRPTRAWDRSGSMKKPAWELARRKPVDPTGQPGTRPTRVNLVETRLIFHAFSLQLCRSIDRCRRLEVIPCSAYAILTIEQQNREHKKTIREIICIKPISSIFKVQSYIIISCDSRRRAEEQKTSRQPIPVQICE